MHKVTSDELAALDQDAYSLGYEMKNFSQWYDAQPFAVRSHTKMKTIRESYERGVEARIEEGRAVIRLCIYIQGPPDSGKTYAAISALGGKQVLSVGGGGTGKFDRLRPDHEAIVIDDDVCPKLLNMTDNYICRAYKRNSNNPAWAGHYFIVTSNLTFSEWLENSGIHVKDKLGNPSAHYIAMLSRFFVCEIRYTNYIAHLALISPSTRGSATEQLQRAEMFAEFAMRFSSTIANYAPSSDSDSTVDIVATLDRFSSSWYDLDNELAAYKVEEELRQESIEIFAQFQARKELGEPVYFDYRPHDPKFKTRITFSNGVFGNNEYEDLDWCNPDRPQEEREELRQKQLIILEKWQQKEEELQQQSEATATQEHTSKIAYNPTKDRMY